MYESHFGITGLPFQLSPDPAFYFDSKGHHEALAALRRGLSGGQGLIVVTGEVGAGKTTLVRTAIGEVDPSRVVEAQICSTQLDADELLRAIVLAYGIAADELPQDALRPALDHFLADAGASGREPVLVVDEAQNLKRSAFELLLSLACAGRVPMRVCLVGQPELRAMLDTGELVHVRRRVEASCHLGPLDRAETAAYIEHRLRKVGWRGQPSFDDAAYDEVFRCAAGIPRRINTLCNRLLMSRFLASETSVDAATVVRTAQDMRAELGGADAHEALPAAVLRPPQVAVAELVAGIDEPGAASASGVRPVLCVVDGYADHIKAATLMRAFRTHGGLPPLLLVRVANNDALMKNLALFEGTNVLRTLVSLGVDASDDSDREDEIVTRFDQVVQSLNPRAVVVFGGDAAVACGVAAKRYGLPLARLGAGLRSSASASAGDVAGLLADQLADRLFAWDDEAQRCLASEGVAAEKIEVVGNLVVDTLQTALRLSMGAAAAGMPIDAPHEYLVDRHGYALATLSRAANIAERKTLGELVLTLRSVSRDLPIIWPMHPEVEHRLDAFKLRQVLVGERIACLPFKPHAEFVALLNNATCVLTDSWDVEAEAASLGIPWLALGAVRRRNADGGAASGVAQTPAQVTRAVWECIFNGRARVSEPERTDGKSAGRIANSMAAWLESRGGVERDRSMELERSR